MDLCVWVCVCMSVCVYEYVCVWVCVYERMCVWVSVCVCAINGKKHSCYALRVADLPWPMFQSFLHFFPSKENQKRKTLYWPKKKKTTKKPALLLFLRGLEQSMQWVDNRGIDQRRTQQYWKCTEQTGRKQKGLFKRIGRKICQTQNQSLDHSEWSASLYCIRTN